MTLESTEALLAAEDELTDLRRYLWWARGRHSRDAGTFLLIISVAFFILAYFTRYIVFEVTSIVSLLLGVVMIFTSLEPYMKTRAATEAIYSLLEIVEEFLDTLNATGKAVFIPPTPDQTRGMVFIFTAGHSNLPDLKKLIDGKELICEEGVLLPSPGSSLLRLYEEELGDLRRIDFPYLVEWLPKVLVNGLKLAERVEITRLDDTVKVAITGTVFNYLHQRRESIKVVCETMGCPLESSIAQAIAKNTGRLVYKVESKQEPQAVQTSITYVLGPPMHALETERRETSA